MIFQSLFASKSDCFVTLVFLILLFTYFFVTLKLLSGVADFLPVCYFFPTLIIFRISWVAEESGCLKTSVRGDDEQRHQVRTRSQSRHVNPKSADPSACGKNLPTYVAPKTALATIDEAGRPCTTDARVWR